MIMHSHALRVGKRKWYQAGGFRNPNCWRRHDGRAWCYYINIDNIPFIPAQVGEQQ